MSNGLLLWIDDEIELLKAHILFLEKKGYEVQTVSNGPDAIELCRQQTFDLILLDEMMPGLSGLETLLRIKDIQPSTPVVMCTKSEEENIMDQAIGSKIADYLIKPVNPNQILLSLKKNIHRKDIVAEVTQSGYQQDYQQIAMQMMECRSAEDWMEIYRRLVSWELKLSDTASPMAEMLGMQKEEANQGFAKYIAKNYLDWVSPDNRDRHLMSPDIFKRKIFPLPVEIRSIDGYNPTLAISIGGEVTKWFAVQNKLGVIVGLRLENKAMTTEATVKNYNMEILGQGGERISGVWTGGVKTQVHTSGLTIPLMATYKLSNRWNIKAGPYFSYLLSREFSGHVYEGYLREGDPVGPKVEFTDGKIATYDFSDDLRHFQWGLQIGAGWRAFKHLNIYADLTWGLNDIFRNDFQTITFAMYPIYLNIGFGYAF